MTSEPYVHAAVCHAIFEDLEGGGVGAWVPACPGVIAVGDDLADCRSALHDQLEAWIAVSLSRGQQLPVIDGIDPTGLPEQALAGHALNGSRSAIAGNYYADEDALEAAFAAIDAELDYKD
jgi:predicted RNase H-like HicB family nuclease